ncbi:MAG: hypothetical protein H6719_25185 [Sandaracinaceae bacterium]|nr:hypothetical protein [Myxococcales bacterium]MCB9596040.1 hypothetical protein [Sandaracinaceae bacterium]
MPRRAALGLAFAAIACLTSTAQARCAPVSMPQEVRRATFVVEAVLERAGDPGTFRTVTVWKGGDQAPATFSLGAQRGRGQWEWADASSVGHRYLLLLSSEGGAYSVARCGQSGEATDARRAELRALGLRPQSR